MLARFVRLWVGYPEERKGGSGCGYGIEEYREGDEKKNRSENMFSIFNCGTEKLNSKHKKRKLPRRRHNQRITKKGKRRIGIVKETDHMNPRVGVGAGVPASIEDPCKPNK